MYTGEQIIFSYKVNMIYNVKFALFVILDESIHKDKGFV